MSEEDERTLWCGNLSEKVSEELLYELFVQAGPVEMVKIPRDNDKRQRSYAFITYGHAASVEYAINIFEGTKLFQRMLTLHKKSKNGPNPAASPKVNFNSGGHRGMQQQQQQQQHMHHQGSGQGGKIHDGVPADMFGQLNLAAMTPGMMGQMMANMQEMIAQMSQGHQQGGGGGPPQQKHLQGKMGRNRNDQQKPYARDRGNNDGQMYSRDRNEGGSSLYSRDRGGGGGGGNRRSGGGNNQRRNDYRGRR